MHVKERKVDEFECPELILMEQEKPRNVRPWMKGSIVKMFGRRIDFKVMKSHLNLLWAKTGVFHIVNLG